MSLIKGIKKNKYFSMVAYYFSLWRRTLILVWSIIPYWTLGWIFLLIIQGVLPGLTAYFTKLTIDSFAVAIKSNIDATQINYSILLLLLTASTLLMFEIFQSLINYVNTLKADILSDYLKNLIHLKAGEVDYAFYEAPIYFDLLEQAKSESLSKPIELLQSLGLILQSTITILMFLVILFSYGWWIPFLLFIGALPSLFIYFHYDRLLHQWMKSTVSERRRLMYYEVVICHSKTAAEVKLFNLNERFRNLFQRLRLRLRNEKMVIFRKQISGKLFAGIISLFTAGMAISWMALNVLYKTASLGDLAIFYQIFSRGQSLIKNLFDGIGKLFGSTLYLEHLFNYLELKPTVISPCHPTPFPNKIKYGITFNNVVFKYPGEKRIVLDDFSLFIPAGRITAIVGINGAGKSTMIKLLCRFYDPDSGSIEIDGIDIRTFDIQELRKNLSLHFQEPIQYQETVAQNIAFGDIKKEMNLEEIKTAAKLAGVEKFVSQLPQQYESLLGKGYIDGCEISGGQWQRIALARAYFRQAQILILDEPTSFMDSWAEVEWFDHLRQLLVDQTGFIITHRFTIAMRADEIHVINDGKIVESGSHKKLLELNGFYAESWKSQMRIVDDAEQFVAEHLV